MSLTKLLFYLKSLINAANYDKIGGNNGGNKSKKYAYFLYLKCQTKLIILLLTLKKHLTIYNKHLFKL